MKKNKNIKKYLPPIIIGILFSLYYIGIGVAMIYIKNCPVWAKVIMFVIPFVIACTIIGAMVQRIKEIKGGEEDDSSKY